MSVVTQSFVAAVNHLLEREPWARAQLAPYTGKSARLNASPFSVVVRVGPTGLLEPMSAAELPAASLSETSGTERRASEGVPPDNADVSITVLPDALAAAIQGGSAAAMKHVRIGGDAEFATTLGRLAEHLRWDPEEDLARWLGDAPAHRIALTARSVAEHAERASRGLLGSLAEYLLDENPQLVRRRALEDFARDVSVLRDDVERLEKRLERLERKASIKVRGGRT